MLNQQKFLAIDSKDFLNDFEQDWFEERAAIYEFDAGFSRRQAEWLAWQEIQQKREMLLMNKAS
ncbi:MAG: hypothetical protein J7L94_16060 [Caldisericaceae bacterium]|nr:hypothetical protein [Caldisericaceae bacterium]